MSGSQISQPSVTVVVANATVEVQNTPQKVLVVGQQTGAATATAGVLVEDVRDDFGTLFGPSSQLAGIIRNYKKTNRVVQVDAIPLDDAGGGTAREVDFTIVGTATAGGTITVVAGSEIDHKFAVGIASGDSETVAAGKVVSAINADATCPFTAANVAGAITLTADNAGLVANDLPVEVVEVDVAGLSIASVTESVAGATDPTLTGVLDVATERYQTIVWPFADTTVVAAYLAPRFNPTNDVLDGVAIVPLVDSFANLRSTLQALNDQNLVFVVDQAESETLYLGPSIAEAPYGKVAQLAGVRALRLTPDVSIARYVISSSSLDQFGGPALASYPYFNTPFDQLPLIKQGRGFTREEIEDLLDDGGTVMGLNVGGTGIILGETVTSYKTDAASNPDVTFKFLNYVDTASNAREYFFNNLKARFSQSRLTEGAVTRGRAMANAETINAYLDKLYLDLAGPDFVLVQDGEAAFKFFKDNRSTTLDLSTGTATVSMLVLIVTQLRTIIATMKIAFSIA